MTRFKLVAGRHAEQEWVDLTDDEIAAFKRGEFSGRVIQHGSGDDARYTRLVRKRFAAPCVFDSQSDDLDRRFNRPGSIKFIKTDEPLSNGPTLAERLQEKTISELRDLADEEQIDLGDASKKADIIQAINEHFEERQPA